MNILPQQFDDRRIRRLAYNGVTVYSLVDICAEFAGSSAARQYWVDTKKRLHRDGFQLSENVLQLKLPAPDGKLRVTDVADAETCLRIVQSIPSPKAEPVRQWLAQVGVERLEEDADPELGIERAQDRAVVTYQKSGKDEQWITARLQGIHDRKVFTEALAAHVANIAGKHYGMATNTLYRGLWDRDAGTLKQQLGLPKSANLRDHQPAIAAHYQGIVEATVAHLLGQAQAVTPEQAIAIIDHIARLIGVQAGELGNLLGIDIATGRPLLER